MPSGRDVPVEAPILAFDLGATNLRCALVDRAGRVSRKETVATPDGPQLAATLQALAVRVRGDARVALAVVGAPGRVDYEAGRLRWGRGQPPEWWETLDEGVLASLLGTSVSLANDADLATVGEARFGSGAGHPDVVYVTISSGVGAGAVLGGRLLRGRTKILEVALTLLALPSTDSPEPTLLEDLASGRALERAAARAGLDGPVETTVTAVRAGDPVATQVWNEYWHAVAATVVNLAHLLLPEVIVVGGGVSRTGDLLLRPVRAWLDHYGPQDLDRPIEVLPAALGDDAGLAGAAAWREITGPGWR